MFTLSSVLRNSGVGSKAEVVSTFQMRSTGKKNLKMVLQKYRALIDILPDVGLKDREKEETWPHCRPIRQTCTI